MKDNRMNIVMDILFLLPFFLALLLQMITISFVWIIVGFGALIMNVKDKISKHI
jgi:hypothetical protein